MNKFDDYLAIHKKAEYNTAKGESESRFNRSKEDMGKLYRFVYQLIMAIQWSYTNVFSHILRFLNYPFRKLINGYRRLWSFVVYYRDDFNNLRFSKTRAGVMFTATALFCYMFLANIPALMFDTALYIATGERNEVIYLTASEELDPENNIHAVRGTLSLPIDEDTSFYFRVEPGLFNQVWSLIHKGGLFYPDYVASAIAPGINRCVVTSYGVRFKTLMRNLDIYPQLLSVSCTPIKVEAT